MDALSRVVGWMRYVVVVEWIRYVGMVVGCFK